MIKGFTSKVTDFLSDTKTALIQMVDDLDQNESLRAQSLGPVLQEGEVTKEMMFDKVAEFSYGLSELVKKFAEN